MSEFAAAVALSLGCGLAAAWGFSSWAKRAQSRVRILARLRDAVSDGGWENAGPRSEWREWLAARAFGAGLSTTPGVIWGSVGGLAALVLAGGALWGGIGALLGACAGALSAVGVVAWRTAERRRQILELLPEFLAHVLRAVAAGSSVFQALEAATDESREPLRGVFARVRRQMQLGAEFDDALEQLTGALRLRELSMLALTVRVNQRYGGAIRDLLGSLVQALNARERARRELRAMTAETRVSAWVLGCLPLALAAYVIVVNPEYLGRMWNDPQGKTMLAAALSLEAAGSLVLWRLVRSL
jgi:tight adherence protein B